MRRILVGIIIVSVFFLYVPTEYVYAQPPAAPHVEDMSKLSLDIKGMDILDVFRLLSMRGELNIISGKNVTGKVTLFLKDVDIWDAFEIIVAANDLAYEKRGDIIYVMTQRDYELKYGKKYEDKRIVKSVKLKYVKATDIANAVSQIKTSIGKAVADEASDTVVLMDIPEAVADMEKVISQLDVPLATKVYSLQYAAAKDLKDKLSEMLTKNVGSLRIDERTNKVAITDAENKLTVFDKVIAAFDEKHKEVIIEAKILQITLNDDYRMGINWDAVFVKMQKSLHRIGALGVNLKYGNQTAVIPTTSASSANGGALQLGQLDSDGYQAVMQALKEYGKTDLLSSPRIAALNNEEAKILVGTNQPYATRSISQTSGGASNIEAENVTFLDLGVKLYVTPTINADNYVTMKIKPEVSSSAGDYTIVSSGNTIPIVKTTTTETTVMVKDGASILIGGLIEENKQENTKEVPGLANIPVLGHLFRTKTTGSGSSASPEKTELVIFLTPHIITGDDAKDLTTVKDISHNEVMNKFKADKELNENDFKDIIYEKLTPQEYYDLISTIITKQVQQRKPDAIIPGELIVAFQISRSGVLVSTPQAYRGYNEMLEKIGIESIAASAPFPPFPESIVKDRETFLISISYQ